jgi:uncharacterized protein YqeY
MSVEIAERIKSDVAAAMKAGDKERVGALRLVLSELQKAEKEAGRAHAAGSGEAGGRGGSYDELAVLRRERKRRRESEQAYREAGRDDLATAEAAEAEIIDAYLPAELSDEELAALVRAAIEETGAESPRDMGKAIKSVMEKAGGRADGRRVSEQVKAALA